MIAEFRGLLLVALCFLSKVSNKINILFSILLKKNSIIKVELTEQENMLIIIMKNFLTAIHHKILLNNIQVSKVIKLLSGQKGK